MKNFCNKIILTVASVVLLGLLTGCNPEVEIPFSVKVSSADTNSLGLQVVTNGITVSEVAYIVSETAHDDILPVLVFADADSVVNVSSSKKFTVDSVYTYVMGERIRKKLEADVDYYIYCAARTNEGFYNLTYMLKARTKDYSHYTEMLSLVDTYHDGYKLRITVPESVKKNPRKYAVRYTFTCLPMYLMSKLTKGIPDCEMLTTNAGMHTTRSKTIDFDATNEVLYDKNGDPVYDENGEIAWVHDPIVPGEPTVFLGAQFQWVEKDDPLCPYGWDSGYHLHMFDEERWIAEKDGVELSTTVGLNWQNDEDSFWKGDFERKFFVVDAPAEIPGDEADIVEVEQVELTPVRATFNVIPADDVAYVCYALLDQATYNAVLPWLDNNEDYMQWFITSWLAVYELGAKTTDGPVTIATDNITYGLDPETKYHLMLVALGDEAGKHQRLIDYQFTTPKKTMPAPEIVVTPEKVNDSKFWNDRDYADEYAFNAHFNIKAPNKDVVSASYAANYVKDWVVKLNSDKATYADVVGGGNAFSNSEIEAINSDKGLDIMIPTVDGETTRLVVMGYNIENTPNNLKVKNPSESTAIADYVSPNARMETRVSSSLFEDLKGEWTAKADICFTEYVEDESGNQVLTRTRHEWKTNVLITDAFEEGTDYPSTLPDMVYDAYKASMGDKYKKESVDSWYEDFRTQTQNYNKYRLSGHNRLLVQGIVSYDPYERLDYVAPFELFYHDKYSSYNAAQIYYDFGPKWYLDIAAGDVVTVPFSYQKMTPLTNWQDVSYYLAAMWYDMNDNQNSTEAFVESADDRGFPVEISDDKNTITIKPIPNDKHPDKPLYLNVVAIQNGTPSVYAPYMSELVLTRGWTDKETTKEDISAKTQKLNVSAVDAKGAPVGPKEMAIMKSMTRLVTPRQLPVQNIEPVSLQSMREKLEKAADRLTERKYVSYE